MRSFDNIVQKYYPGLSGRWNITLIVTVMCVMYQPFVHFGRLAFLVSEHRCRQPTVNASWSPQDIVNLSIPFKVDALKPLQVEQAFSPCTEYDVDRIWPLITNDTTLEDALVLRSSLYPNLTVRKCTRGVFFNTSNSYLRRSAAMDFGTVCGRSHVAATTNAVYMLGILLGVFSAGPLSDNFGRRPVMLWGSVLTYTFALLVAASVNVWMFALLRLLLATLLNIIFVNGWILLTENADKDGRNTLSILERMYGNLVCGPSLLLFFYLTQDWRWTHAAYCWVAIFIFFGFSNWIESPRWLLSQGRRDEAYTTILTILKRSGKALDETEQLELKEDLTALTNEVRMKEDEELLNDEERKQMQVDEEIEARQQTIAGRCKTELERISFLFRDPFLRRRSVIVITLFFLHLFVYYGINFNFVRLKGNPYIIVMVMGAVGIPGIIAQYIAYRFFDRKTPMVVFYGMASLMLGAAACLVITGYSGVPVIAVSIVGAMFVDSVFNMLYIRIPELFPTSHRVTALGMASGLGRFGAVVALYVERLDELVWAPLPLLIFSAAAAMACAVSMLMPPGRGEINVK